MVSEVRDASLHQCCVDCRIDVDEIERVVLRVSLRASSLGSFMDALRPLCDIRRCTGGKTTKLNVFLLGTMPSGNSDALFGSTKLDQSCPSRLIVNHFRSRSAS